jgi:hypothetical protein
VVVDDLETRVSSGKLIVVDLQRPVYRRNRLPIVIDTQRIGVAADLLVRLPTKQERYAECFRGDLLARGNREVGEFDSVGVGRGAAAG